MNQSKNQQEFVFPLRVYYEDTDAGGIVYYANYLKFFERARSEWLFYLGLDQVELLENAVAFVVKQAAIDYISPARLNDALEVVTQLSSLKAASVVFKQAVYKSGDREKPLVEGEIQAACLNMNTFKPCRFPTNVKEVLASVC
ncbi:MAG: tol-pal system-associated acyl-CoA thioesterase [Gammaproteobacteria bacterium]|nr:tol-pal system-associated acyl-CoA thioesterase [Gammaproteobacteria bacterium]MDH5629851.1 tol-pal system-associated acyl-CoA thioesterase [Gammaproteobacteria bacterium]